MIVLDASAAVQLLLDLRPAGAIAERLRRAAPLIAAPHLLDAEVGQVLRRQVRGGNITASRAREALADLADLPITRYPHLPLLPRAFALRHNLTVHDALYLVLAESLAATLVTMDAALAAVPGVRARVEVL